MCLIGHIVEHIQSYGVDECLLVLPKENAADDVFQSISKRPVNSILGSLEGSYMHYDPLKRKWIRTGKASGLGKDACFNGRLDKHTKNAWLVEQLRKHRFYQEYPAKGVKNIGGIGGYFDDLVVYCGMAFDRAGDVLSLCSEGAGYSLFV